MRGERRPGARAWTIAALLAAAATPTQASAQGTPTGTWGVVPLLGFGVERSHGDWGSAGMEAGVAVEYGSPWRWGALASWRGLGVACAVEVLPRGDTSDPCFDGGVAFAIEAVRVVGRASAGLGVGTMRQFDRWRALGYGRLSFAAAPVRFDVRLETRRSGPSVYLPLLVGFPIVP